MFSVSALQENPFRRFLSGILKKELAVSFPFDKEKKGLFFFLISDFILFILTLRKPEDLLAHS